MSYPLRPCWEARDAAQELVDDLRLALKAAEAELALAEVKLERVERGENG
jgi:hypothetical protein